jgi:predicted phage terminase large subunit-like protein
VRHKVKLCQFESNSAGGRTADVVQEKVKKKGGITHITKKRTTANKETKIIVNSAWVKEHCLFKDEKVIQRGSSYDHMIKKLCSHTMSGKNKHDDVPDGMAQYAIFAQSLGANKIEVMKRPF